MLQYILRRIFLMIPTLLGITVVVFFIIQSSPGGPVEMALQKLSDGGQGAPSSDTVISQDVLDDLKRQFGFDKPIHVRYFLWIKDVVQLEFGNSIVYDMPVYEVIKSKFPVSIQFGFASLILTYIFCVPLGIAKAVKDKKRFDYISSFFIFLAHSTPGFVLGILLIVFFGGGSFYNFFPIGGMHSATYDSLGFFEQIIDRIHHAILPVLCYMVSHVAVITMLMKNSLIGELSKDYIKTAKSKGVPHFWIIYKHALRNALIPIATGIGTIFKLVFTGSLLVETVFNLDGIGLLSYTSVIKRDYPVIMASVCLHSVLIMLGNIASDVALVLVDPRIDYQ